MASTRALSADATKACALLYAGYLGGMYSRSAMSTALTLGAQQAGEMDDTGLSRILSIGALACKSPRRWWPWWVLVYCWVGIHVAWELGRFERLVQLQFEVYQSRCTRVLRSSKVTVASSQPMDQREHVDFLP
jgi:hypothetical protein